MQVPETPATVQELDLMRLLERYAKGESSWTGESLGPELRQACNTLHAELVNLVNQVFAYLMDRANAREMDLFTMHDRRHGQKVAHLMWHITDPDRRSSLTPPEIGLMVLAAYLHDAGMAVSRQEREKRLAAGSDLWQALDLNPNARDKFYELRRQLSDAALSPEQKALVEIKVFQAEEALLTEDTRARHAKRERYFAILDLLAAFHDKDHERIPDIARALSFDGFSFKDALVDICVSHNESANALVEPDKINFQSLRFSRRFPVGRAVADLQFVAAALRLSDILDFDRERTPAFLFHYLVPGDLDLGENFSQLEWNKHLAISNWHIEPEGIVFRARCRSHLVHHAVVQFCKTIEEEITRTREALSLRNKDEWQFVLPTTVKPEILEEGYHYVPYHFELDDQRIYSLLMGGAIYDNPLVAIRELIQNAVDACKLRDALTNLYEPHIKMGVHDRIVIRFEEGEDPKLVVQDTGTGMDEWIVTQWFLKVGRSYYSSKEFNKTRLELRSKSLDFAPVSEFGIGFLSCFLLSDRVEVETTMWEPVRGDTRKRHLTIDGPSRLIRLLEDPNTTNPRFKGTTVTLHLVRGGPRDKAKAPRWDEVRDYVRRVCLELPYVLRLERHGHSTKSSEAIEPDNELRLPPDLAPSTLRIAVSDQSLGIQGEIALLPGIHVKAKEKIRGEQQRIIVEPKSSSLPSVLIRGGFYLGKVPGLAHSWLGDVSAARIRCTWEKSGGFRYQAVDVARTRSSDDDALSSSITKAWLHYLICHQADLPVGLVYGLDLPSSRTRPRATIGELKWLDDFSAYELYLLARNGWSYDLARWKLNLEDWEACQGPQVKLGSFLVGDILSYVLPRICTRRWFSRGGDIHVFPPECRDWKDRLSKCHDFISKPVFWRPFAEFEPSIDDYFFREWSSHELINERYKDLVDDLSNDELEHLMSSLTAVITGVYYNRPAYLNELQALALRRVYSKIENLKVGHPFGTHVVRNLNINLG